jgi:hypothetical protein
MPRRVGSPKADVMALTCALNAPGVSDADGAEERGADAATPIFYLWT